MAKYTPPKKGKVLDADEERAFRRHLQEKARKAAEKKGKK